MSWIKEKHSWVIHTNEDKRGWFDPLDPPHEFWKREDLVNLLGESFEVVALKGKWSGQVFVHSRSQGFSNELADNLAMESLGRYLELRGKVLMTKESLISL